MNLKIGLRLALAAFTVVATEGIAQSVVADYGFDGTYGSEVGNPLNLDPIGNPEFATETVDGVLRTVLEFPAGSGCRVPSADLLLSNTYTIAVLVRLDSATSWRRVIDFKNRVTDWGLYSYFGNLNFYAITTGTGGEIVPGAYVQIVMTRSAEGNVRGYVNGNPEIEFIDSAGQALVSADGFLSFFQDDLVVSEEHSSGAVARIRIWDAPLSAAAVASLDRLPGDGTGVAPAIAGEGRVETISGVPFDYEVVATGDHPLTFSATGLPEWLSFDALAGRFTGTAGSPGIYEIQVSVFNAAGSDSRTLQMVVEPEAGSVVSFDPLTVEVWEDAGEVTLQLVRLGDVSTPASISFQAIDGTGFAGQTYVSAADELELSAGEAEWTIKVPLLYQVAAGPDVDFFVEVVSAVGTTISQQPRVRVVVLDRPLQKPEVLIGADFGLRWRAIAGLRYQVETSTDLVVWEPVGAAVEGMGDDLVFPIEFLDARRFYRLAVGE